MTDALCETCGIGYLLPSGVCDHCNTAAPDSDLARLGALLAAKEATIQQLFKDALRKDQLLRQLGDVLIRLPVEQVLDAPQGWRDLYHAALIALGLANAQRPEGIHKEDEPQNNPDDRQGPASHEAAHGPVDDHEHKQD